MGRIASAPYQLHVRALRSLPSRTKLNNMPTWEQVAATLNHVAGKTHYPLFGEYFLTVKSWVDASPVLASWIKGGRCLASPSAWPEAVLPFFKYRLIPTPYEVVNVQYPRNFVASTTYTHLGRNERSFLNVLLYSMGLLPEEINPERDIALRSLAEGITWLVEDPRFIIWATGTDFSRSTLPFKVGSTLNEQMSIIERLKKNPFLLSKEEARPIVESPTALTYLIYSTHKQPRLTPTNSNYVTDGVFDADQEG